MTIFYFDNFPAIFNFYLILPPWIKNLFGTKIFSKNRLSEDFSGQIFLYFCVNQPISFYDATQTKMHLINHIESGSFGPPCLFKGVTCKKEYIFLSCFFI